MHDYVKEDFLPTIVGIMYKAIFGWIYTEKGENEQKRLKMAEKKYFNQLSGAHSTRKVVEIHINKRHLQP